MGLRAKVILGLVLFFVIFTLRFLCANCQQAEVDLTVESSRLQPQQWKAVTTSITFSNWDKSDKGLISSSSDPYESWPSDETPLRRRRPGVRKRKRRPQGYTTESTVERNDRWRSRGEILDETIHGSRNQQFTNIGPTQYKIHSSQNSKFREINDKTIEGLAPPTAKFYDRNEKIREPMAALEREQKLSEIREKQKESIAEDKIVVKNNKSYRRPYSQVKREKEENSKEDFTPKPASDLKNILKNSGSLSLSEILQQKNLSLDDLLKGKQNALLALQTTTVKSPTLELIRKPVRRVPWSFSSPTMSTSTKIIERTEVTLPMEESEKMSFEEPSKRAQEQVMLTSPAESEDSSENNTSTDEMQKVIEIATLASLRDNPPLRKLTNTTVKNVVFPKRQKSPTKTATTITTKATPLTSTIIPEMLNSENNINSNDTRSEPFEGYENIEPSTFRPEIRPSFVPQYRKRPPIKPRPKITPLFKFASQGSSSSSSSESSSNDSSSEKKSRPRTNKIQEGTGSNPESIEDRLKETLPDDNLIEKFPSFSAIGNKMVSSTLEELFGSPIQSKNQDRTALAITPRIDRIHHTTPKDKLDVTESNPSLFLDITSDHSFDDRTDLLELIEDRRTGGRLFKVLAQRNMTLEELIEHRRRGSSQLHLAEIIQNKSKTFPEPASLSSPFTDSLDIVTAFENFPHFNLANFKSINPDEIKTDSQGSSYFTSIIDIEPTDEAYKEGGRSMKSALSSPPALQAEQQQQKHINLPLKSSESGSINGKKINHSNPQMDSISLASYTSQENSIDFKHSNPGRSQSNISPLKEINVEDPVVKIEDEVARAHDLLDLELSGHGFKRSTINIESAQMTTGIRSAIVASSAIVATSLLVFLVIFMVCRWKQKRRNKLSYIDSYTAIKSRLPSISRQSAMKRISENSSPIIFPGSKNGYKLNTMDPNSPEVQEYLFDTIRKPF